MSNLYSLFRPALFKLDPEVAHNLAIKALSSGLMPTCRPDGDPRLKMKLFDLEFPNPLGMAAGFDKNAVVPDALLAQGFGHVEVGTVTPKPQPGNPKPRLFRIPADRAVVNRFGFNNEGHQAMRARLLDRKRSGGIIGVNIGANKDSEDRTGDYVKGIDAFADLASFFIVNVSSPNTPGLRDLQARAALEDLLGKVLVARDAKTSAVGRKVPVFLKIAPDLDDAGFEDIVASVTGSAVDGVIVSNTTLSRDGVSGPAAKEAGGVSGRPLFERSTRLLARMRLAVGPELPLIGVGGVESGPTALAKILAGANLVQVYTGYIYEGLGLPARILKHLSAELDRRKVGSVSDLVGIEAEKRVGSV
ncbi:dihydroorotate dehydrogenase [Rhodobium orientis]|uniref:Dihydroorotate dehydrogenase (quinone) n=1 Tax=Rhodobium orientis TaxID=34017 RepID=A0A327JP68_9HYPH|nr:quinone-dependent dihydroorotate dehydrogenase [Rhodobium orientis]MBB4304878.1 dihydroorotate dehydrogenase [Rhodobium orientis]MBK5949207.1 dihydroorotate dehydrogenase (quinone) [Rhodobium orientis]RAI27376.1 dihydroorotate dehydrogenase (quinone) [Rhodobium orientis]